MERDVRRRTQGGFAFIQLPKGLLELVNDCKQGLRQHDANEVSFRLFYFHAPTVLKTEVTRNSELSNRILNGHQASILLALIFVRKRNAMPYIPLEEHLPGITGLLEYRKDTAGPIRELTQFLLRGPNSLTEGERELIATIVSHRNQCKFCVTAHTAAADLLLGEKNTTQKIKENV